MIHTKNAFSSVCRFLTEDAGKTLVPSYISHGWTTATVSSWVHLILSSNHSRKFKTLLQDLFSWHPATTTQHFWKNCTGFPFQNILVTYMYFCAINGSGLAYLSELLHVYIPSCTLCCSSDTCLLKVQQYKCKTHGIHTLLLWSPHLEFTPTRPSTLSCFKARLKTFLFSQYFHHN